MPLLHPWQQSLKKSFLLSIFTLALFSTASGQAAPRVDAMNDKSMSVAGSVTDQRGDPIRGATVSLRQPAAENAKKLRPTMMDILSSQRILVRLTSS